ncbi:MAG: molybdenum cofactor guanylyltransferase [Nitrospirae bacterium]|nr:molybdenum cofactor guanylyltransferase [Nitrospirota bacterium]
MNPPLNCTGIILAGGENKRMPEPKAFLKINGECIIERGIKIMRQLFNEIFIITNQPEAYFYLGVPLFGDTYNVRGPMTGIFTSFVNSSHPWVFVTACDMPFINEELIKYMASKREDYEAVVPKSPRSIFNPPLSPFNKGGQRGIFKGEQRGDFVEPLFAFYSSRLSKRMEEAILSGKTGLRDFLKDKKVRYIPSVEIEGIDPEGKSFINLNTPQDVKFYLHPETICSPKKGAQAPGLCGLQGN